MSDLFENHIVGFPMRRLKWTCYHDGSPTFGKILRKVQEDFSMVEFNSIETKFLNQKLAFALFSKILHIMGYTILDLLLVALSFSVTCTFFYQCSQKK